MEIRFRDEATGEGSVVGRVTPGEEMRVLNLLRMRGVYSANRGDVYPALKHQYVNDDGGEFYFEIIGSWGE